MAAIKPHSEAVKKPMDTENQLSQLNEVASVERQFNDLGGIDDGAHRRVLRL